MTNGAPTRKKADKNVISVRARFMAAAELSGHGWVCAPTNDNAPTVDLLAASPDMKFVVGISVKGMAEPLEKADDYFLIKKSAHPIDWPRSPALWWAFVHIPSNRIFWVPSTDAGVPQHQVYADGFWNRADQSVVGPYLGVLPTPPG